MRNRVSTLAGIGLAVLFSIVGLSTRVESQQVKAQPKITKRAIIEAGGDWCYTEIDFKRRHSLGTLGIGDCPTGFAPDVPATRDANIPSASAPMKIIRLRFHVFANDDGSNLAATSTDIADTVKEMNTDYAPWRIFFIYTSRQVFSTTYASIPHRDDDTGKWDQLKNAYSENPATQLNVFVTTIQLRISDNNGLYGSATFPWESDVLGKTGGVMMNNSKLPAVGAGTKSLSHEVGHVLGLYHTHRGVSDGATCSACWYEKAGRSVSQGDISGDLCSDTQPTPVNFNCADPGGTDSCSSNPWGATPFRNLMGYANDSCINAFTAQQAGRMHGWINNSLTSWLVSDTTPPTADITAPQSSPPYTSFRTATGGANDNISVDYVRVALRNSDDQKWWVWTANSGTGGWGDTTFDTTENTTPLDNASNSPGFAWSVTLPNLGAGHYEFLANAVDASGNALTNYTSAPYTIDNTGPTVTITIPKDNDSFKFIDAFVGTAIDPAGIKDNLVQLILMNNGKYWNGSVFQTGITQVNATVTSDGKWAYTMPVGTMLNPGKYRLIASAKDINGISSETLQLGINDNTFFVDDTSPQCIITTPSTGAVSAITSVGGTFSDNLPGTTVGYDIVRLSDGKGWDNTFWGNGTQTLAVTTSESQLADGTWSGTWQSSGPLPQGASATSGWVSGDYEIRAFAYDKAGNVSAQATFPFSYTNTFVWTGGTLRDDLTDPNHLNDSNNWDAPGNWLPIGVPGAKDTATIDNGDEVLSFVNRTVKGLNFSAGRLAFLTSTGGNLTLTTTGASSWRGGEFWGSWTNLLGATFTIAGTADKFLVGGLFQNQGTVIWSNGNIQAYDNGYTSGNPRIYNTSIFNITGDGTLVNNSGAALFTNLGTINRTTSTGTGTITMPLFNKGTAATVNVQKGTLSLEGGGFSGVAGGSTGGLYDSATGATLRFSGSVYKLYGGTRFTGAGTTRITAGEVNILGAVSTTGTGTFEIVTGGVLGGDDVANASGTLAVKNTGRFSWTGGEIRTTNVTIEPAATLSISGVDDKVLIGGLLTNQGTATWIAGNIQGYDNGISLTTPRIVNSNIFYTTGNGTLINNSGAASFTNTGTLNLGSSVFNCGFPFKQTSTGTLQTSISSATVYGRMIAGGAVALNGTVKPVILGTYAPAIGAAFKIIDPPVVATGTFTGLAENGTLNIGNHVLRISYVAGDGDDVVLTKIIPGLSINSVSLLEGNTGEANKPLNFTVTLSARSPQAVTVNYATSDTSATIGKAEAGKDYVATSGTLTIPAGQTTGIISVAVKGDNLNEANETFFLTLSQPTNAAIGASQGIGTIVDNDALPVLSTSNIVVTEGTGGAKTADFTINLSAPSGRVVSFTCNTADGTARTPSDYTATRVNLTIPAGATFAKFSVPIATDATDEVDELFYAFLTAPINAKISTTRVQCTITDDDAAPLVSIADTGAKEYNGGTTSSTFHINLSAPSGKVIKVMLTTANRTAGANIFPAMTNVDYVPVAATAPIVVSISAGQTVGIARVTINGDTLDEENETFLAKISLPENATLDTTKSSAVGTIIDDDAPPTLSVNDVSIAEGSSGSKNMVFTLALSAVSGKSVTVNYATANGTAVSTSDYVDKNGTLTFAPGSALTRTIIIPINGDTAVEGNETFFVLLSGAVNASIAKARGVGTITNDDSSG